jgi:hypothetical protein
VGEKASNVRSEGGGGGIGEDRWICESLDECASSRKNLRCFEVATSRST